MAVGANNLALGDLIEDRLPGTLAQTMRDIELLVTEVIELEDERILFPAVDAASLAEEVDKICRTLRGERTFSEPRVGHISLAVLRIMLLFVCRATGTAVVVALPTVSSAPGEF